MFKNKNVKTTKEHKVINITYIAVTLLVIIIIIRHIDKSSNLNSMIKIESFFLNIIIGNHTKMVWDN